MIPSLPYSDTGGTCGATDDYPPPCWGPGGGPDVVYVYTPPGNEAVTINLCGSSYDTGLYVVRSTDLAVIACVDDACGLQSRLNDVPMVAGTPYYIVVDGYSTACGAYTMTVSGPCAIECPPGAIAEGEPDCFDGYIDNYNGGCNSLPAVFQTIACSDELEEIVVCGKYGTYIDPEFGEFRDTDWYEIVLSEGTNIQVTVVGEAATQMAIVNATGGCEGFTIACGSVFSDPCIPGTCSVFLPAGTYWIFVAPSVFAGVPCGRDYVLSVRGYECTIPPPPPPMQGMYGSTRAGQLLTVNTTTGVASFLANLPTFGGIGASEIEYDVNTKEAYVQGVDGSFTIQKFDIDSGAPIGGPVGVGASFAGLEVVGSQLYGTGHTGPCAPSFLAIIDPNSGLVTPLGTTGFGPITGLAYDDTGGDLYGLTGCATGNSLLVRIDRVTGAGTPVGGGTGFEGGSLEFGEDGVLYGGGSNENGGRFYRIDTTTGAGTLIGPSGFPNLTGLTLVPKTTPVTEKSWGAIKAKYHR
ncbi:MAG: hypothetical protein ACREOU_01835 [Candidatus Eiseniibacteriota bacterium]